MHRYAYSVSMHSQNMDGNNYLFSQASIFPVIQSKLVNQQSLSFHNHEWNISIANEHNDNILQEEYVFHMVSLIGRYVILFSQSQ